MLKGGNGWLKGFYLAQVFPVAPLEIEGTKPGLAVVKEQIIKLGPAVIIERDDLAVEDGRVCSEFVCDRGIELAEGLELVLITRHEPAFASVDIGERPEPSILRSKSQSA